MHAIEYANWRVASPVIANIFKILSLWQYIDLLEVIPNIETGREKSVATDEKRGQRNEYFVTMFNNNEGIARAGRFKCFGSSSTDETKFIIWIQFVKSIWLCKYWLRYICSLVCFLHKWRNKPKSKDGKIWWERTIRESLIASKWRRWTWITHRFANRWWCFKNWLRELVLPTWYN